MNAEERSVADTLLARIRGGKNNSDISCAIARYREFVEACNFRERKLVSGWSELATLEELDTEEGSDD